MQMDIESLGQYEYKKSQDQQYNYQQFSQITSNFYNNNNESFQQQNNKIQNTELKQDHQQRPIWIASDLHIFLETFNKLYSFALSFLVAISEPISRPAFIHEYEITQYSLYSAMVLGFTPQKIINILLKLTKNKEIPQNVVEFIERNTRHYGKAKLFLANSKYFLEVNDQTIITQKLSNRLDIYQMLEYQTDHPLSQKSEKMLIEENPLMNLTLTQIQNLIENNDLQSIAQRCELLASEEQNYNKQLIEKQENSFIYKINGDHTKITKFFIDMNMPLVEEYDYKIIDDKNPMLQIQLKSSEKIRHYQQKALNNVFIQGKAKSGVLVLPCGAGKTFIGIVAIANVQKRTIIFCDKGLALHQWQNQIQKFAEIDKDRIILLSSEHFDYDKFKYYKDEGCIVITTYTMMAKESKEDAKQEKTRKKIEMKEIIKELEWGLCILDEVQVVPADTFQKVLIHVKAHFKLGLTATLIREDMKITELNYMIGPKLYEENWLDLVNEGYLARPYCVEVRCKMPDEFLNQMGKEKQKEAKIMLYAGNPNKFLAIQYLIKKHEARGDKIIVFGDKPFIIEKYAKKLKCPALHGEVSETERKTILKYFQNSKKVNTVFLSRVGDTSIDLPIASVVIQISSHFGSRRQEAQRLGRILRPKLHDLSLYNAFFYTLVSLNTVETIYANKRQKFLVDQGFSFEIITKLPYEDQSVQELSKDGYKMLTKDKQQKHMNDLLKKSQISLKEIKLKGKKKKDENDSDLSDFFEQGQQRVNPLQSYSNLTMINSK